MSKKRILYAIFLLVLSQLLYAVEERIYSGVVYSNRQQFDISNATFSFSLSASNDKISVILPTGTGVIVGKSCEIRDYYKICFNGVTLWYHNYTTDKEYYNASVDIYQIVSKIGLARTIESTTLFIGEETRIDVAIKNTEDREATDIIYSDSIPLSFTITDVSGCVIEYNATHNNIRWYGSLGKNIEKKCSYTIKALRKTSFVSKASVSYYDGAKRVELYSDSLTIAVPEHQLNVSSKLDKDEIGPGEEVNLNITLTNVNSEKDILVTFDILIPSGLKVIAPPKYLRQDFTKYNWAGTLLKEGFISFIIGLKGEFIGDYTISPKVSYSLNNIRNGVEINTPLKVYSPGLSLDYRINKATLRSSDNATITIEIKNPSTRDLFKDIMVVIESTLPGFEKATKKFDRIKPLGSKKIDDIIFTAPDVETKKDHQINISVQYESYYNQILRLKEEKTITIVGEEAKEAEEEKKILVTTPSAAINETNKTITANATAIEETNISVEEMTPIKGEKKNRFPNSILIAVSIGTVFVVLLIVGVISIRNRMMGNG